MQHLRSVSYWQTYFDLALQYDLVFTESKLLMYSSCTKLYFSLSSSRRLAIKPKWLTLDSSVSNPSVPFLKTFRWFLRKSLWWRSSTSWISGLFTNRSVSSAAACYVLNFICWSKNQQPSDLTYLWKPWRLVHFFCAAHNFTFEREVLSQTVLTSSMRNNFVNADIPNSYT